MGQPAKTHKTSSGSLIERYLQLGAGLSLPPTALFQGKYQTSCKGKKRVNK